ncbi:MAG: RNA polymerase sigma factor [Acidobacteriota bacterium]
MDTAERDNETWVTQLRSEGPAQQMALSDLRSALLRGLRRALATTVRRDESFYEDVVQDALVRILAKIHQYEGRSRFLTWATSVAISVGLSELRRRRWKDVSLQEVIADVDFSSRNAVDTDIGPAAKWEKTAILKAMYSVIHSELTEKQRIALLAELRGMPQDEIARHLGTNRNAVYKLTHDARKRLKRGLEAAGYRSADVQAAFSK